jgi:hypothetical protein
MPDMHLPMGSFQESWCNYLECQWLCCTMRMLLRGCTLLDRGFTLRLLVIDSVIAVHMYSRCFTMHPLPCMQHNSTSRHVPGTGSI